MCLDCQDFRQARNFENFYAELLHCQDFGFLRVSGVWPHDKGRTPSSSIPPAGPDDITTIPHPLWRRSAGAQERRSAGAQERRSAGAQERRSAGAQERRSAGAQERRSAGAQERRSTVHMSHLDCHL